MAFDDDLAERVRLLLATTAAVTERKMFGGLAFMVRRHMTVVVSGQGGIMSRVHPDDVDDLVKTTPATFAEMRGSRMRGWVRVAASDLDTDEQLAKWVDRAVSFSATLPAKD